MTDSHIAERVLTSLRRSRGEGTRRTILGVAVARGRAVGVGARDLLIPKYAPPRGGLYLVSDDVGTRPKCAQSYAAQTEQKAAARWLESPCEVFAVAETVKIPGRSVPSRDVLDRQPHSLRMRWTM